MSPTKQMQTDQRTLQFDQSRDAECGQQEGKGQRRKDVSEAGHSYLLLRSQPFLYFLDLIRLSLKQNLVPKVITFYTLFHRSGGQQNTIKKTPVQLLVKDVLAELITGQTLVIVSCRFPYCRSPPLQWVATRYKQLFELLDLLITEIGVLSTGSPMSPPLTRSIKLTSTSSPRQETKKRRTSSGHGKCGTLSYCTSAGSLLVPGSDEMKTASPLLCGHVFR
ncbi:hypothetical protein RRG08_013585 [Elysia crispata]|uniref:Uncharacterized protein n=1 Tax=Elysia crispata TaxID=231223 RepID=A0AAE1CR95_9GAST|nr:hypothetical protein RRG08_013585 [Elysia crispata]